MGKIDKEKLLKEMPCVESGLICRGGTCKYFLNGESQSGCVRKVIKNFPEEPAIDFDTLYDEWKIFPISPTRTLLESFLSFLKSKNLTQPQVDMDALRNEIYSEIVKTKEQKTICAVCGETKNTPLRRDDMGGYVCLSCIDDELTERQKQRELPVKKTWTLKKEYYDFSIDMFQPISLMQTTDKEPKFKKYYDQHDEVDYSAITKDSIVEFKNGEIRTIIKIECGIVYERDRSIKLENGNIVEATGNRRVEDIIRVVEWAKEVTK